MGYCLPVTWARLAVAVTEAAALNQTTAPAPALSARRAKAPQPAARGYPPTPGGLGDSPVTRSEALMVPSVHRGVDLISSTVGSFPLRSFKDQQDVTGSFLEQPEIRFPCSYTIAQTVRDLIFDGIAYWLVTQRDAQGYPAVVERAAPHEVTADIGGSVIVASKPRPARDLIVFLGPDSDWSATSGLIARGLLSTGASTIRAAARLEQAAARFAWMDIPTGVITTDEGDELDDDEIQALLSAWEEARRQRATAFLPSAVKWSPTNGPDPERLQLNESRQYIASEVARHLNLPPRYVGASSGDSMTYNSQTADRRDLVDLGLRPWVTAIEAVLSMPHVTPRGQAVRLDATAFITSDPKERADVFNSYLASGVTDVEEVRQWLNLPARIPRNPQVP